MWATWTGARGRGVALRGARGSGATLTAGATGATGATLTAGATGAGATLTAGATGAEAATVKGLKAVKAEGAALTGAGGGGRAKVRGAGLKNCLDCLFCFLLTTLLLPWAWPPLLCTTCLPFLPTLTTWLRPGAAGAARLETTARTRNTN